MVSVWWLIAWGWLAVCNLYGFFLMGWDKRQAKRGAWRVRERTFFLIAAGGGALGVWLGMRRWRHKTKHLSFRLGIPLLFIIWGLALMYILVASFRADGAFL
ncbi:MAG TPA: DUF1294 domain-containing protein [Bacilli bacterium]|nr:DUF1294 domain-containing protein [Bacilli bacterium]